MSNVMNVKLTTEQAGQQWGNKALLTSDGGSMLIHLPQSSSDQNLSVQRAARRLQAQGISHVKLTGEDWSVELQWAFAKGYSVTKGQTSLAWATTDQTEVKLLNDRMASRDWARAMINGTPEDIYPQTLAVAAIEEIKRVAPDAVSFEIIKGEDLIKQGWVGVHTVGRASVNLPLILELDYNPTNDPQAEVSVALVGKGITFDSGGYTLKSGPGMITMKCDMGGAATVTAALSLAISQGLNKRVKLILCCAENLVNGEAYKLGDIITYKNGTTVEILNTDAEGRLVLADGLMMAANSGAKVIIDAATLTGAALTAVGTHYNAIMALDNELAQQALACGKAVNEMNWQLPLERFHQFECPSPYADTANTTAGKGGVAGASNAAGFLSRFVPNDGKGWIHFDLAAVFQDNGNAIWCAGATGLGIETIAQLLLEQ